MDATVTYIVWNDASHQITEVGPEDVGLIELHEVGFLFHEDAKQVTISIEKQVDAKTTRMWMSIPKVNIIHRIDLPLKRAFPPKRSRVKSSQNRPCPSTASS